MIHNEFKRISLQVKYYENHNKWPDKSITSYAMLDFESDIENLLGKYLVIERHILQIQDILLQYFKFN